MNQNLDIFNGFSRDEWITPELAQQYLERNARNRKLQKHVVDKYAKLMSEARFCYGDGVISFNEAGELVNGQHRLSAIIKSQKTVKMVVVRGLHQSAYKHVDSGRTRTVGDALSIEGKANAAKLGSASRLIMAFIRNPNWTWMQCGLGFLNDEIIDFVNQNEKELRESLSEARKTKVPSEAGATMAHFVLGKISEPDRNAFWEQLRTGENLKQYDPAWTLRKWMTEEARTRNNGQVRVAIQVAAIFKAWNAFRDGKQIRSLKWKFDAETPEPFPTPR